MAVDVRWATTGDAAALAVMLCEMAVHYRQPPLEADRALSAAQKWLGAERHGQKVFLRLSGEALKAIAKS